MTNNSLMAWAQRGVIRIRVKMDGIESKVWLTELWLRVRPENVVNIQEKDDPEPETTPEIVRELENKLKVIKKLYGEALKSFSTVNKIAQEGNFTESLQKDALKAEKLFSDSVEELDSVCKDYKEDMVNDLISGKGSP